MKQITPSQNLRPTTIYVDESGISRQSPYLAIGALKMGNGQGLVVNQLEQLRSKSSWTSEARFSDITSKSAHLHREATRIIAKAEDTRFRCVVLDQRRGDKLLRGKDSWRSAAQVTIKTLTAAIWNHEVATAVIDHISVPPEVNYEGYITAAVNRQIGRQALVSAVRMHSRSCWGLQMADVLTGAVAHQYRQKVDNTAKPRSPKGRTAADIAGYFNLESLVEADSQKFKVFTAEHRVVKGRSTFHMFDVA